MLSKLMSSTLDCALIKLVVSGVWRFLIKNLCIENNTVKKLLCFALQQQLVRLCPEDLTFEGTTLHGEPWHEYLRLYQYHSRMGNSIFRLNGGLNK